MGRRIRTLRKTKGVSQYAVAKEAELSREYVRQLEAGRYDPTVGTLTRLAGALGVPLMELLELREHDGEPVQEQCGRAAGPASATAPASRLKFGVRLLFPRGEAFSVPLARLMMATNDARHLQKLLIMARERVVEANEIESAILNGELNHLFRLMCGHLWEAAKVFNGLDRKGGGVLDTAMTDARAKEALARVRAAYSPRERGKGKRSFIDVVRNFVAFHYNEQKLGKALEKHERAGQLEGTLILSPFSGLGRYTVTDNLATLLMADEVGGTFEEFSRKFGENVGDAIRLAGDLGDVVDYLIAHILSAHTDKIERRDRTITIDPLIARAREEVEKARKARDRT